MRRVVAAGLVVVTGGTLWVSYELSEDRTLLLADRGEPAAPAPTSAETRTEAQSGTAPSDARTVTGPVVETGYGPIQVEVSLVGGRVEQVRTLVAPESSERSVAISERAVPLLDAAAVAVRTADIDTVTGATYTSDGYRQSLQAALDEAAAG